MKKTASKKKPLSIVQRVQLKHVKKLHKLLAIALKDLELVENDSRYKVRMSCWMATPKEAYEENPEKRCEVCLAGSVLAKTCKITQKQFSQHFRWGSSLPNWTDALDMLRKGEIAQAFWSFYPERTKLPAQIKSLDRECNGGLNYEQHPVMFKMTMRYILAVLKNLDL